MSELRVGSTLKNECRLGADARELYLGGNLLIGDPTQPEIQSFYATPASAEAGVDVSTPVVWRWAATGAVRYEVRDLGGGVRYSGAALTYSEVPSRSPADLRSDMVRRLYAFSATNVSTWTEERFRRLDPPEISIGAVEIRSVLNQRVLRVPVTISGDPFPTEITISPEASYIHSATVARLFRAGVRDVPLTAYIRMTRTNPPIESVRYTVTARNSEGENSASFTANWQ